MKYILEIDSSLSEKTVLYRTLDFFGAAPLIKYNTLMFSRADTFSDKNEGVDRLLAQLQISMPNSGCGMGWRDRETARSEHEKVKRSHYISCWSTNPESVAMWSLYSPDYCSVRVSTTVGKLRLAIEALLEKYSVGRLDESCLKKQVVVAIAGKIEPVTYASIPKIAGKVMRRAKATAKLVTRYERKGLPVPRYGEIDSRYWAREDQRRLIEIQKVCNLKDVSFQHEAEVRLSVRLGEEICSTSILDSRAFIEPEHEYHTVLKNDLAAWGMVSAVPTPEREFVALKTKLIDAVALDPRCPNHKANFIRKWLEEQNVKIVASSCFGYMPDSFDVFPDR